MKDRNSDTFNAVADLRSELDCARRDLREARDASFESNRALKKMESTLFDEMFKQYELANELKQCRSAISELEEKNSELKQNLAQARIQSDEAKALLLAKDSEKNNIVREFEALMAKYSALLETETRLRAEAGQKVLHAQQDRELAQLKELMINHESMRNALWQELREAQSLVKIQRQEIARLNTIISMGRPSGQVLPFAVERAAGELSEALDEVAAESKFMAKEAQQIRLAAAPDVSILKNEDDEDAPVKCPGPPPFRIKQL